MLPLNPGRMGFYSGAQALKGTAYHRYIYQRANSAFIAQNLPLGAGIVQPKTLNIQPCDQENPPHILPFVLETRGDYVQIP